MFELVFVCVVLATIMTLGAAAVSGVRGKRARARRSVLRVAIGLAVYLGVVVATSFVIPQRVYRVGEAQCFDDWCIEVASARRVGPPPSEAYEVSLTLSNHGRARPWEKRGRWST